MSYDHLDELLQRHQIDDLDHFGKYLSRLALPSLERKRGEAHRPLHATASLIDLMLRMARELHRSPEGLRAALHFYVYLRTYIANLDLLTEDLVCTYKTLDSVIAQLLEHRYEYSEDSGYHSHGDVRLPGHGCYRLVDVEEGTLKFPHYYDCAAALRILQARKDGWYAVFLVNDLRKSGYREVRNNVRLATGQQLPKELVDHILECVLHADMPLTWSEPECRACKLPATDVKKCVCKPRPGERWDWLFLAQRQDPLIWNP